MFIALVLMCLLVFIDEAVSIGIDLDVVVFIGIEVLIGFDVFLGVGVYTEVFAGIQKLL